VQGPGPRPAPPNALTDAERAQVLSVLTSDRFIDKSVAQAWATLLDEGTYLCSRSTMHRILRANDAAGERRAQATHPPRVKPELVATRPGQVWSWDITKLRGPERGVYYDLYVVLDIFSRYVVAWTVAACEDSPDRQEHARGGDGCARHPRGRPRRPGHLDDLQTGRPAAGRPGVDPLALPPARVQRQPLQRGRVQDAEVRPGLPRASSGRLADARAFGERFFGYYNHEHRHSGIGLHTPASVHYGTATEVRAQRQATLDAAYATHPDRFGHRRAGTTETAHRRTWINQPSQEALIQSA
jgi:putative transposase